MSTAGLLHADLDHLSGDDAHLLVLGLMLRFKISAEALVSAPAPPDADERRAAELLEPWTHRRIVAGEKQAVITLPATVNDSRVAIEVGGINLVEALHIHKRIVVESDDDSGRVTATITILFPEVRAVVDKVKLPEDALEILARMNGYALVSLADAPICTGCGAQKLDVPEGVTKICPQCATPPVEVEERPAEPPARDEGCEP